MLPIILELQKVYLVRNVPLLILYSTPICNIRINGAMSVKIKIMSRRVGRKFRRRRHGIVPMDGEGTRWKLFACGGVG